MNRFSYMGFVILTLMVVAPASCEGVAKDTKNCSGKNEVSVKCEEPCQPSCSWPNRPKCPTFTCSKGCECATGYYRSTNQTSSPCVKCVKKQTCCKHEELSSCANPCQPSCSWKNRPPCPTFTCSTGCVCKKNFYRATNETSSRCVRCK